jgi:hypothetical protein
MQKSCQKFITLTVTTVLVSLLLTTTSFAEIGFKGNVGIAVNNQAIFRGIATMHGTDFQTVSIAGIKMTGAGPGFFSLGILGKYSHNMGAEAGFKNKRTDVTLAYTLPLLDDKLSLTVGNVSYLPAKESVQTINEALLSAKFNVLLNPTFTFYYDYEGEDNGLFMTAEINKGFKITEGLKLGLSALVSYNDESSVKMTLPKKGAYTGFHNAEATASLIWAATKQLSIVPNLLVSTALSDDAEQIANVDDEFRYGVKMVVKF